MSRPSTALGAVLENRRVLATLSVSAMCRALKISRSTWYRLLTVETPPPRPNLVEVALRAGLDPSEMLRLAGHDTTLTRAGEILERHRVAARSTVQKFCQETGINPDSWYGIAYTSPRRNDEATIVRALRAAKAADEEIRWVVDGGEPPPLLTASLPGQVVVTGAGLGPGTTPPDPDPATRD